MSRMRPPPGGTLDACQLLEACCEAHRNALVDLAEKGGIRCLLRWEEMTEPEHVLLREAMKAVIMVMAESIDHYHGDKNKDVLDHLRRRAAGKLDS
jgi:hypothetical protein